MGTLERVVLSTPIYGFASFTEDGQERFQNDMGVDKDTSLTVEKQGSLQMNLNSSLDLDTSNNSQHPSLDDTIPLEADKDLDRAQGSKSYLNNPNWFPEMRGAFKAILFDVIMIRSPCFSRSRL